MPGRPRPRYPGSVTEIPIYGAAEIAPEHVPEGGERGGSWERMLQVWDKIARNLPDPRRERLEAARGIYPVRIDPTPVVLAGGFGVLDIPQFFSPGMGSCWDVHTVSATGFTAGTVGAWLNLPAGPANLANLQGALRASFIQAGVQNFGKAQCWLRSTDRLVFVATGITVPANGQVLVSFDATNVDDEWVGKYLS
jgi:hypothetical protein